MESASLTGELLTDCTVWGAKVRAAGQSGSFAVLGTKILLDERTSSLLTSAGVNISTIAAKTTAETIEHGVDR